MLRGAIFDIDGTLVDSVDAHARAWSEAFATHDVEVSVEDAHGQIGKGGDQLLPVFLSKDRLEKDGPAIEKAHGEIFRSKYRSGLRPFPRVRELFLALRDRGVARALASSSKGEDLEFYVGLMGIGDLIHAATSSEDAENSKPAPDIFGVALKRLSPVPAERTLAFGDSPWDAQSAGGAGLRLVGLRCGGFGDATLTRAGAIRLYDDPAALLADLDTLMTGLPD